jgi:hypothetical protein
MNEAIWVGNTIITRGGLIELVAVAIIVPIILVAVVVAIARRQ